MTLRLTKAEAQRIAAQPGYSAPDLDDDTQPTPAARPTQFDALAIVLPYPPSANVYWRMTTNRRTGRSMMVRSADANRYRLGVGDLCTAMGIKPLDGDLVVHLYIFRPQRSGDLDNRIKVVLDALQGYAYHNDDQIVEIHAYRNDDKDEPRAAIKIEQRN